MTVRAVEALVPHPYQETEAPGGRGLIGPYLVFVVLISATIPWRNKAYFEGALDPVVLAKAALSLVALLAALLISVGRPARPLRASPVVFLMLYLVCTVLGGWSTGSLIPSAVIAIRVMLLATVVVVLSRSFQSTRLLGCLIAALATFAAAGAATGIPNLADGRLRGEFPPLHPNEMASTCALVILWCLWKVLAGEDTWVHLAGIAVASVTLLATGSRTPMAALVVGALVLMFYASALRLRTLALALMAAPIVVWLLGATGLVSELVFRGQGAASLNNLSNRTIAWQAALEPKSSPWVEWLGAGLSMKRIEVAGQWWNRQILDSSWVSALVQGGLIGLGLCVLWLLHTLATTADSPRQLRALQLAVVVYLGFRGVLESGLFDASTAFLVLFATMLASPVRSANGRSPARGRGAAMATGVVPRGSHDEPVEYETRR